MNRRRWVLPAFLGLVLVASGGTAVAGARAATAAPPAVATTEGLRVVTPVLSVRRVAGLLSRTVSEVRLGDALDGVLADPALAASRATTCLTVEDGDTWIYSHNPETPLIPASTTKVVTGMAALRRLGDGFRFVTEIRADVNVVAGVVDGPLWFVGAGDPLLSTKAYADTFRNQPQVFTSLDVLADDLVRAGVREVRGGVLGDESRFDTERYLPSWKPTYISSNQVGPLSALVVNDNFSSYRPRKVAAAAPARQAAEALTALLRDRGVIVAEPGEGMAPPGARTLASAVSAPLPEIVGEMLRESDNMTAEVLTKELGRRFGEAGSWAEGVKVIRSTAAEAGLSGKGYVGFDGSGLDVSDRLSCSLLMDALDLGGPDSAVASGFAVAGQTGTLAQRFKGNPAEGRLRAKTGSLSNVSGLVGYVDAADDRTLEFALLANGLPDASASGRELQERVGAVLAAYPDGPAADAIAPLAATPAALSSVVAGG